ncbi:MAG: hypothetical protein ACPHAS_08225 [Synechococcus sp.]
MAAKDLLGLEILYPIEPIERQKAAQFDITSGNWKQHPELSLSQQLLNHAKQAGNHRIVLSSESLFWHISSLQDDHAAWSDQLDLEVILAVRDIEEMLSSEYQQRVKRHGEQKPFEQFLRNRHFVSSHHRKAAEVLSTLKQCNIPVNVINYSKNKSTITELVFKAIGARQVYPSAAMDGKVINRSLSQKELQTLTVVNALYHKQFPWISARLSDALAKQLPNVLSQQCRISKGSREKLYTINNDHIAVINQHLAVDQQLISEPQPPRQEDQSITRERNQRIREEEQQSLELISTTLMVAIQQDQLSKRLSNGTVDALIQLSHSPELSKESRIEILEIAKLNRPQGQRLSKLLDQARLD